MGLETGPVPILLHVRTVKGHVRNADGSVVKKYAQEAVAYPLQCVLRERPRAAPGLRDPTEPAPLALCEGSRALFLGQDHYGCIATVLADPGRGVGRDGQRLPAGHAGSGYTVRVAAVARDAGGAARLAKRLVQQATPSYLMSGVAARQMRLDPRVLGRLAGNVWVNDGETRADIGLAVKNAKQELCVPGARGAVCALQQRGGAARALQQWGGAPRVWGCCVSGRVDAVGAARGCRMQGMDEGCSGWMTARRWHGGRR